MLKTLQEICRREEIDKTFMSFDSSYGSSTLEGGLGVMVNSFICPVQLIVFCFFNQRLVSLIMSFLIQEYEWLTTAKREIWRNGIGKMYNYIFHFLPAN